jgi:two-component system response regulator FlrC
LNVVPARLLPLRERLDDIPHLARAFLAKRGYPESTLTAPALEQLQSQSWRGNVRELFNVLERAAIIADGTAIEVGHLMIEEEFLACSGVATSPAADTSKPRLELVDADRAEASVNCATAGLSVREMEEQLIFETLKQANNNRTRAAKMLGISVRTLRNKLKVYRERFSPVEA